MVEAVVPFSVCVTSLMMCGILAEMDGRYEEAEIYLERATSIDTANVVAWTLFGEQQTRVSHVNTG